MPSGFEVEIPWEDFDKKHREYATIGLRMVWWNLGLLFHQENKAELTVVKQDGVKATFHRVRGIGWITLYVLPFAMLHETLHFILAYLTSNEHVVILVPGLVDLVWFITPFLVLPLPVSIVSALVMIWMIMSGELLLISNIRGDFGPYLTRASAKLKEQATNPPDR